MRAILSSLVGCVLVLAGCAGGGSSSNPFSGTSLDDRASGAVGQGKNARPTMAATVPVFLSLQSGPDDADAWVRLKEVVLKGPSSEETVYRRDPGVALRTLGMTVNSSLFVGIARQSDRFVRARVVFASSAAPVAGGKPIPLAPGKDRLELSLEIDGARAFADGCLLVAKMGEKPTLELGSLGEQTSPDRHWPLPVSGKLEKGGEALSVPLLGEVRLSQPVKNVKPGQSVSAWALYDPVRKAAWSSAASTGSLSVAGWLEVKEEARRFRPALADSELMPDRDAETLWDAEGKPIEEAGWATLDGRRAIDQVGTLHLAPTSPPSPAKTDGEKTASTPPSKVEKHSK